MCIRDRADVNLPRQAGKLIELQSAVAIRPKIKAILDKEYLPFADRVVKRFWRTS